ncbi:NAD(P)-binding protein [Decorospora gaudefroyi]|uniref:NAD(P)-binding protein n=1 Tax=Decorospora gaudefroyi TaxID=184978 RepID=A0A6A5KG94_9PLEO|nr:NAD(P)-binding protein [Decorospora gaudefroyi]
MAIGIALIGSGIFAKEEHLPAIQDTPSLSLKAVYSRSLKSAKALSGELLNVELYSDDQDGRKFEDLLKRDDVQGMVIALPILAQPEYIKRALAAGKHVLAEKPIAKDLATAQHLLKWTQNSSNTPATYTVAENFRFIDSYVWGSEQIASLGRILTFRVRVAAMVKAGSKYYETAWRKNPEYQGGFLLDGGVHFVAATRLLLKGGGQTIKKISAYTAQLQEHLPPVDTLNATMQLDNGSSGTFSISFGTTDTGSEYLVACEKGVVHVARGKVTVTKTSQDAETKEFLDEGNGVNQEIKAWAQSLVNGKRNDMQSPDEALKDLEILESCLKSGEQGGKPVDVKQ